MTTNEIYSYYNVFHTFVHPINDLKTRVEHITEKRNFIKTELTFCGHSSLSESVISPSSRSDIAVVSDRDLDGSLALFLPSDCSSAMRFPVLPVMSSLNNNLFFLRTCLSCFVFFFFFEFKLFEIGLAHSS